MKRLMLVLAVLLAAVPSHGFAASHSRKHMAAVQIPTPGAFGVASLGTISDETIGVANEGNPNVDVIGTERSWIHAPSIATTWKPGYSVTASVDSYDPAPNNFVVLLAGTPYEIKFKGVALQGNSSGWRHFDDGDLFFDGALHHYTDADRNLQPINIQGATLSVHPTSDTEATWFILVTPGGETYEVSGLRF